MLSPGRAARFAGLLLCALGVLSATTSAVHRSAQRRQTADQSGVRVRALAERNPAAKGSEVWILALEAPPGTTRPLSELRAGKGWGPRGGALVFTGVSPADVVYERARPEQPLVLTVVSHPWSGRVRVEANGRARDLDLFSDASTQRRIVIAPAGPDGSHRGIGGLGLLAALARGPFADAALPLAFAGGLVLAWAARRLEASNTKAHFVDAGAVSVAWAVILFLAWRPGTIVSDSFDQIAQALSGTYNIQHSPAYSALLGGIVSVAGSPVPLLAAQLLLVPAALVLLLPFDRRPATSLVVLTVSLWLPVTWTLATFVGKDSALAIALLLALAAAHRRRQRTALALVVVATAFRANALLVTLPIAVRLAWELTRGISRPVLRRAVFAALALLPLLANPLQVRLTKARQWPMGFWLQAWDLAGIYREHPSAYDGSVISRLVPFADLNASYTPVSVDSIIESGPPDATGSRPRRLDPIATALRQDELQRDWLETIVRHPGTYLGVRGRVLLDLLTVRYLSGPTLPNRWGWREDTESPLYRALFAGRDRGLAWTVSRGAYWLTALLGIGALLLVRRRLDSWAFWASLSGVSYTLGYAFIAPAVDHRYLFPAWTALLGAVAIGVGLLREPAERARQDLSDRAGARLRAALLAGVCLLPLFFSGPTLRDPYGQTEESVNATIWGLGARNILEKGPVDARFGALVAPFPGYVHSGFATRGLYAHHPPLPVWVSAVVQLAGDEESLPRAAALLLAALALFALDQLLRRFFPPGVALAATAVAAASGYALGYGRLLTTLTLATPLFVLLLDRVTAHLRGEPLRRATGVLLFLLCLTSWDGVLAAGTASLVLAWSGYRGKAARSPAGRRVVRSLRPVGPVVLGLLVVGAYLLQGGASVHELLAQALQRTGMEAAPLGLGDWLVRTGGDVVRGLGPVTAGALLAVLPLLRRAGREFATVFLLALVPGAGMIVLFREGAYHHTFWGYNLLVPGALAIGYLLRLASRSAPPLAVAGLAALLLLQGVSSATRAAAQLREESRLNANGALARDFYAATNEERVVILSAYDFHPYVNWYIRRPTIVIRADADLEAKLATGEIRPDAPLFVDGVFAGNIGCGSAPALATSAGGRWTIVRARELAAACP